MPRADLAGRVFGRLVVTSYAWSDNKRTYWTCRCECGSEVVVRRDSLIEGRTVSCGCRMQETRFRRASTAITYNSAHHRVRRGRGSARLRPCADCGQRARDWSYIGGCSAELAGEANGSMVTYCPVGDEHEKCYVPRCVSCHRIYDNRERAA